MLLNTKDGGYEHIFEQIARHYETLSSNEQLVIDFVMRDHNIDRLKIKTITDALFVSSATVMRAARKLGYSNFSQLKYSAAMTQDEQAAPLPSEDFDTITGRITSEFDKTLQMLSEENVAEFVEHLNHARRIFCVGSGSSVSVVGDFTRKLKLLDYWINDFNELYSIRDIAGLAEADDVIVILSLGGGNHLVNQFWFGLRQLEQKLFQLLELAQIQWRSSPIATSLSTKKRCRVRECDRD